jgi:glycosyltransferase involved in cell wall biosynthesis
VPGQLVVVHNGVRAVPAWSQAVPAKARPRIVSVARFEAPKDHATLLRALARLDALDWELDLVGDGLLETRTRALAARLGIAARVHFLGYQPDVAACLGRAQLFVLSSRSEAYPRSVLEAMSAGLPVVATNVGGLGEALNNGESGILVPRDDVAALSAVLRRLIEDPLLRQRLGVAARLTYESRHRLECMIERTAVIYESAVSGNVTNRTVVE